ncbi:MAG: hypothetical protein M2R45_02031 [Verrucomicrobia subdivision 3 bacterium]|nr:hypothetical protein [Limisphaerales bacterium]MCS1414850.1 hypothetical protein [Limisphaerales bacterium]
MNQENKLFRAPFRASFITRPPRLCPGAVLGLALAGLVIVSDTATGVVSPGDVPDGIWDRISRALYGDRSGKATAQQTGVYIQRAHSVRKSWQGDGLSHHLATTQRRNTIISENPLRPGRGDGIDDIREWRFGMYDGYYGHYPSGRGRWQSGSVYREPPSYIVGNKDYTFASPGWVTGRWSCIYEVRSSYSNTNGDQRLNGPPVPSTYTITVTYWLAKLENTGMGRVKETPFDTESEWSRQFSTAQSQTKTAFLLKPDTSMYESPRAYGKCHRYWEWRIPDNLEEEIEWYIHVDIEKK